jgi:TonB family protein
MAKGAPLMRSPTVRLGRAAAICALLAGNTVAHAQEPVMNAPRLERFVEAADPRTGTRERVAVELELDVDRDGTVTSVRVIHSGGEDLDASASAAAEQFVFEPATRDGKAFPSRVRYQYVFAAQEQAPPEQPATADAVSLSLTTASSLRRASRRHHVR